MAVRKLQFVAGMLRKLGRLMKRRTGDIVEISGDYQYRALTEGGAVQRFWHYSKQLAISRFLPVQPGQRAIDVGCGSGVISSFLGRRGAEVLGVDSNPQAVEFATGKFATDNVRFAHGLVDETFHVEWGKTWADTKRFRGVQITCRLSGNSSSIIQDTRPQLLERAQDAQHDAQLVVGPLSGLQNEQQQTR